MAFNSAPENDFTPAPVDRATRQFDSQRATEMVDNTLRRWDETPSRLRAMGGRFYHDWHEDAEYIGKQVHQDSAHGSAMLARLSPGTEAESNRMMAYQTLHLDDKQTAAIHASAELKRQERAHPKGSPERAKIADEASRLRKAARLPATPLNLQTSENISQVLHIRDGEVKDPLGSLGKVKINDFGHAIEDPRASRQTIDTHYHDVHYGSVHIPYAADRQLGRVGRYEAHQHVARQAHQKAIETERISPETPPNDFMGAVWMGHQQAKAEENPNARKSRKATESRNINFMSSSRAQEWDPAAHGQRSLQIGEIKT